MTFGERLIELRTENGYAKRNEFANVLGIPSTTLRNYETNIREPGHKFLKQISKFFNVSVDYLLCLTEDKEKTDSYILKTSEYEHLEKYRNLDDFGRESVDITLARESQRVQIIQQKEAALKEQAYSFKLEGNVSRTIQKYRNRVVPYYQRLASAGVGQILWDDLPPDEMEISDTYENRLGDFALGVNGDSMEPIFWDCDIVLVQKVNELTIGEVGIFVLDGQCYLKELGYRKLLSKNPEYPPIIIGDNSDFACIGKVLCNLTPHSNHEIAYMYQRREQNKHIVYERDDAPQPTERRSSLVDM